MNESIYRYFQIGTLQWMSYPEERHDFLDSIRAITCDDFFNVIELGHIADDAVREKARSLLRQSHMRICYAAQPMLLAQGLNPNAIVEADRSRAEAVLLAAVEEAEYLDAVSFSFMAGTWEPETREKAYDQLLKTTRAVCARAAEKGMTVELEIFDYDMDKSVLIGPAPLAARFAADMRLSWHNFGLLADLSHFPATYETAQFVVRVLRPYISHFHIGNAVVQKGCEAYGDKHPRFGFPNSANDVAELLDFFRVLRQEGFFDPDQPYVLSTEVKPWGDEDAEVILANSKRVIRRAWALLEGQDTGPSPKR